MIDMQDPIIRRARNNRRLLIATITVILALGLANIVKVIVTSGALQ